MTVNITIRNVPTEVRDRLAARAAAEGKSMQEYLLGELERLTSKLPNKVWAKRARDLARRGGSKVTTEDIVAAIREGRGE